MRTKPFAFAAACSAMLLLAGQALAREKVQKEAKPRSVTGTVAVTKEKVKDDAGAETELVKSITLTSGKKDAPVVYNVVLDDNGKKLAALDGKRVKATGAIAEKDGNKWLTVQTCEEVVKQPKPRN